MGAVRRRLQSCLLNSSLRHASQIFGTLRLAAERPNADAPPSFDGVHPIARENPIMFAPIRTIPLVRLGVQMDGLLKRIAARWHAAWRGRQRHAGWSGF